MRLGKKKKSAPKDKIAFIEKLPDISQDIIAEIRNINDNAELLDYWNNTCADFMPQVLGAIMSMGTKMAPLFSTSKKLAKIAGEELAAELCTGCTGVLESMKPLLMLEDVIAGKVSREEYIKVCGHRSVDEMELARPYPYEAENFPERIIAEHKKSGVNAHLMQRECEERYNKTVKRFKSEHPNKAARFDKIIAKYIKANHVRENIRSKSVWIFCIIREFMLKTGDTVRVNGSAGIVEKQAVGISQTHL